jgi:dolichyldiphosphatase
MAALKAVTLTHVRYGADDMLGLLFAWASLLPVFISLGGFVTHFLFRRELQAMFFAFGLLLAQFFSEVVKKSVKEARPLTCQALEMCDSHGWPSSHSVYMAFFSIYLTLLASRRLSFSTAFGKLFVMLLPWPFAAIVMYSRIYLGYHSLPQVIAGCLLGLILGISWFLVVNVVLIHTFPILEELPICRYFYIRDSSHIPDVMCFEYQNSRAARKAEQEAKRKAS